MIDMEINKDFDSQFNEVHNMLKQMKNPDNFEIIYDFAKRIFNQYGFSSRAVEMIYLLGYIDKQKIKK